MNLITNEPLLCGECETAVNSAVRIGGADYEQEPTRLCLQCLKKAVQLLEQKPFPMEALILSGKLQSLTIGTTIEFTEPAAAKARELRILRRNKRRFKVIDPFGDTKQFSSSAFQDGDTIDFTIDFNQEQGFTFTQCGHEVKP